MVLALFITYFCVLLKEKKKKSGGSERPADESNEGETPLTWGECLGYLQQAFRISMGYHSSQESR